MNPFNENVRRQIPRSEVLNFVSTTLGLDPRSIVSIKMDSDEVRVTAVGATVNPGSETRSERIYPRKPGEPLSVSTRLILIPAVPDEEIS